MEMSVAVNVDESNRPAKHDAKRPRGTNQSDLDTWLEKVETLGELKRITAEVDPDLEASTLTYLVGLTRAQRSCSRTSKAIPGTALSTT